MIYTQPFAYQLEDVGRITTDYQGRALLSWDMGLGKTLAALLHIHNQPQLRPAIVVCPAGLKWMWQREAATHFGLRAVVLEGTKPPPGGLRSDAKLIVVNYDILGQRRSNRCGPGWLEYLQSLNPQIVILDEIQSICTRSALRSKCVRALCEGVPSVVGLSGTPLTNRPSELWHPLHVIRPDLFPAFFPFAQKFCAPRRTPWGWDFSGASNLNKLHRKLTGANGCMIRRRKADVLKDLPPKRRSIIPLDLSNRKEYNRALHDFLNWLEEISPAKARSAARAETITQLGYLKQLAAKLKLPGVFTWIDDFLAETDEKLIIFAIHRKIITEIHERYGNNSVVVDGSVTGQKRQRAVDQFLLSKNTRLFIGNIKAAGTGWSAKGVTTTGFVELPWDPGSFTQAGDRTHGIKRGKEGVASQDYIFLGRDTIDESHWKLLIRKSKILNAVMDNGEGETLDLVEELTRQLLKGTKK